MATLRCSSIGLSAPKAQVQRAKVAAAAPRVGVLARAQLKQQEQAAVQQEERSALMNRAMALSAACGTLLSSGNALAAQELAQVADSDGRLGILLTLFVPVVGWVLFNIGGPLFGQLDVMGDKAKDTPPEARSLRVKRSVAGALGLGAAGLLAASAPAEAATELAQLADSDGRLGILLTLFVPVVGWVLFNIAGPLFGQLDVMGDKAKDTPPSARSFRSKRSVAGALGLGAAGLLAASAPAEAATELAQLADSDGRLGILLTLFVPVVGWVLFNIAGPLFGQLDVMGDKAKDTPPSARSIRTK